MTLYVFDTDILTLHQCGHDAVLQHVQACSADQVAVTVISVEEQMLGWYTRSRRAQKTDELARAYEGFANAVSFLSHLRILPFAEPAILRYEQLRAVHKHIGKNDLRIAAIVLEHTAVLVTRNLKDFQQIAGLNVEDWSK